MDRWQQGALATTQTGPPVSTAAGLNEEVFQNCRNDSCDQGCISSCQLSLILRDKQQNEHIKLLFYSTAPAADIRQ